MKRVFLAFPVDPDVRRYLAGVTDAIARKIGPMEIVRWVGEESMHITAHFLGDQDDESIRQVSLKAGEVAGRYSPVGLSLQGIKTFPERGPARVIVASLVEDDGMVLRQLQAALGRELHRLGIEVDRRIWTPHITLGRVKTSIRPEVLRVSLDHLTFTVDELRFIESQLTDDGSLYSPLAGFPLKT